MMETQVNKFFERYERLFAKALRGEVELDEASSFYTQALAEVN